MLVVDIRHIEKQRNIEVIEVNSQSIYYYEEKNECNNHTLYLFEYNINEGIEKLIITYVLDSPTLIPHAYSFQDSIMIIFENGSKVFVMEIDKKSYKEVLHLKLDCIGQFSDCKPLNSSYILIYTIESDEFSNIFSGYKETTGCSFLVYLYDLNNKKKYIIKDPLLRRLFAENIHIFHDNNQEQIMLMDPYSSEELKESYYKEASWIDLDISDNIWTCPLTKIIDEICSGSEKLPLELVLNSDINGSVRFIGFDNYNIYFKRTHFSLNKQNIISYNKISKEINVELEFDIKPKSIYKYRHITNNPFEVYDIAAEPKYISVKGIYNSNLDITYSPDIGDFIYCIENRFIICKTTEEHQNTLVTIFDPILKTREQFSAKFSINENILVLY